jgi:hypothetical protein
MAQLALGGTACGAEIGGALQAELRRGFVAAGTRTSDEPALRLERQSREPSQGFRLGAALGAWINAAETLDYDLKTPSGDGDDTETIHLDCYDEKLTLERLETARRSLDLAPEAALKGAGVANAGVLAAWRSRQAAAPSACR